MRKYTNNELNYLCNNGYTIKDGSLKIDAGNHVEVIRYAGTFHAFFDRLGYVPQAEAVCMDIVERLNR